MGQHENDNDMSDHALWEAYADMMQWDELHGYGIDPYHVHHYSLDPAVEAAEVEAWNLKDWEETMLELRRRGIIGGGTDRKCEDGISL